MSFIHAEFEFPHIPTPVMIGDWDIDIQIGQFPSVNGESHLIGSRHGSDIHCHYTISGYETDTDLEEFLNNMRKHVGEAGEIEFANLTFPECTFLGFSEEPGFRFYDGSGTYGWVTHGILRWRIAKIPE